MKKLNKISKSDLDSFIQEHLFENVMKSGLDSWSNYVGHDWSGWLCGPTQTRDADALARSNYRVALDLLGGEQEGKVETRSVGHWACGHFDQIMVKNEYKNRKAIKTLFEIEKSLEGYPVLDESDFSQEESDEAEKTLENFQSEFEREFLSAIGFKNSDVRVKGKRESEIGEIIARIFWDDMGYRGLESAWVNEKSVKRYLEGEGKWDLPRMAKEGNKLASALISRGLVKPIENVGSEK